MLLCLTYLLSNKDLLSPAVLMCIMFIVCIGFAIINIKNWNIHYQVKTFVIMLGGIASFVVASFPFYYLDGKKRSSSVKPFTQEKIKAIKVDKKIVTLFTLLDLFIVFIYAKEVMRISVIGGNRLGLRGASFYYRNYTAMNSDAETVSTTLNQFLKLSRAFGYVSIFILAYNSQSEIGLKGSLCLIPMVLLGIIQNLIGGGRGLMLWYLSTGFTVLYIMNMQKYYWKRHIGFKYIKIGAVSLFVVLLVFYFLKYWLRIGNTVNSGIDYISYYAGGSIENFNLYIQNPPSNSHQIWGQETFVGLHATLASLGIENNQAIYVNNSNLEFRRAGAVALGNVYGAIRRYYNDFGLIGVIILQIICSLFYNAFYYRIKWDGSKISKWYILFYAFLSYHIFEMPIDDTFYKSFISLNMLTTYIVLYCVYFVLVRCRIKKGFILAISRNKRGIAQS